MDEDNNFDGQKFIQEMAAYIQGTLEKRFPELSRQDKEDILHEIQLKLWKMILSPKKINNFYAYVGRIIYTTALDMVKKKTPYLSVEALARKEGAFLLAKNSLKQIKKSPPSKAKDGC